jgi:hypothetical protein
MSNANGDWAERCGRLFRSALNRRVSPVDDSEYLALIRAFLSDADFKEIANGFAQGLGLRILSASTQTGLVLGTTVDSPFQLRREDYDSRLSASGRLVQGLIHLAIAAWCFPKAEDLKESDEVLPARLTVDELVDYLHLLCEQLKGRDELGITISSPEVRMAWEHVLALGKYADSADGRGSSATLAGKVRHALNFLTDHGFLKREGPDTSPMWLARPSLRIYVRELAGHEAFTLVSRAAKEAHG